LNLFAGCWLLIAEKHIVTLYYGT